MPTHYHGTAEETLALNTFIRFTRAYESLTARLAHHDVLEGLTVSQFGVLEALYHLGPMCQGELSGKLLKSCGNITLVLDNLEKRGLVRRMRQPEDRRMVKVSLTDAGEALIARIFPAQVAAIVAELGVLDAGEQQAFGALCKKLGKRE
ncbi:MAG: MarR family winged helix-turn-helix transcriptional regulator [Chloroflexota bacterium]